MNQQPTAVPTIADAWRFAACASDEMGNLHIYLNRVALMIRTVQDKLFTFDPNTEKGRICIASNINNCSVYMEIAHDAAFHLSGIIDTIERNVTTLYDLLPRGGEQA